MSWYVFIFLSWATIDIHDIVYQIQAERINLNLDTAVPLGLIICELITNAFKHAFLKKNEGELIIKIYSTQNDNSFFLEVQDNGNGINSKESIRKQGLGGEIIEALTEQLDGELNLYSNENGTLVKIFFKQVEN